MVATTWIYLLAIISFGGCLILGVWLYVKHMQLQCAEEHISLAFHPELGWAIPPEIHKDIYDVATKLHAALDHLYKLNRIKTSLANGDISPQQSVLYKEANLTYVNETPVAWQESHDALDHAYKLLGPSPYSRS